MIFVQELVVSNEQTAVMNYLHEGNYQVKEQRDKQSLQDLLSDGHRHRC
jgi:hypothetical protein